MNLNKEETIIFIGDSVTDCGRKKPNGEGSVLSGDYGNGYVNKIRVRLAIDYPTYNIRIINKGSNGERSKEIKNRFLEDVISYHPNRAFILVGVNDAWRNLDMKSIKEMNTTEEEYYNNLKYCVNLAKQNNIKITLITPFLIERYHNDDSFYQNILLLINVVKKIASEENIDFIDLQEVFTEKLKTMEITSLTSDRVHPGEIGHTIIADTVLCYLQK